MEMSGVIRRFAETASVLRLLPEGSRNEHPYLPSWSDYLAAPSTAYGSEEVTGKPLTPSPAAIQRMEEVLTWL